MHKNNKIDIIISEFKYELYLIKILLKFFDVLVN